MKLKSIFRTHQNQKNHLKEKEEKQNESQSKTSFFYGTFSKFFPFNTLLTKQTKAKNQVLCNLSNLSSLYLFFALG